MRAADGGIAREKRGVGRPRDPQVDQRLKAVSLQLLAEQGFAALSVERICAIAGLPRATFYRRWPTGAALASEAFNERFETGVLEATGDLEQDLLKFAIDLTELYNDPILGRCLLFILSEAKLNPALTGIMAQAELSRRKRNIETLSRALEAGAYDPGMMPRMILNALNSVAHSTFISNRRVTATDYAQLITKLLQRVEAKAAVKGG